MALRRFLGLEGSLGRKLGLAVDVMSRVIETIGNDGEIFECQLGTGSLLQLECGSKRLWY